MSELKDFKMTWQERVCDGEGDFLYMDRKTQIIKAESHDAACDLWEAEHKHDDHNGLHDCEEVVEHDLFKMRLVVAMPDGFNYAVPVELIARHRAEHYAHEFGGNEIKSLLEDTVPLFDEISEIRDWAANNMNWSDVKDKAVRLQNDEKPDEDEFEDAWVNGDWKVVSA